MFIILLSFIVLILVSPISAGVYEFSIENSRSEFLVETGDFVRVYSDECIIYGESGSPQVLAEAVIVLLPQGMGLIRASIESERWEYLAEGMPFPAQPPAILSCPTRGIIPCDESYYIEDRWFPENPMIDAFRGNLSGFSLASISYSPIRWNPSAGICEYLASARVRLEYESSVYIAPSRRTPFGDRLWKKAVAGLVLNPEEINSYTYHVDSSAYDWAVITPYSLAGYTSELLDLRRSCGLRDTTLIISDIYSSFAGVDNAEKIRNSIIELYEELGIVYVLLIGDTNLVPARTVYAMDSEADFYDDENEIRADLYYSDLDGNWNFDGDIIYGELEDSIDMFPDVHVGRFSLSSSEELLGLIDKLITYESIPSEDFAKSGLMIGQVMWDDPYTDGGEFNDDLIANVFPDYFDFGKVYSTMGGNAESAFDSLNTGPNLVNHVGHANSAVLCVDHGSCIYLTEMDLLVNYARPSILFSIGCWPAAFDKDCFAEHFVNNPSGGGVAFIGNSRYGWGSPGNVGRGYSEVLDKAFWEEIFDGNFTLGSGLDIAKARYVPFARWENIWRWVIYQVNIIGDPATGAITGYSPIEISYDLEGADVGVGVETPYGMPVMGAVVSAYDNYGLLDDSISDPSGFARLSIAGGSPPIFLVARYGSEGMAIDTITTPTGEGYFRWDYSDSYGLHDFRADAGDTVEVVFGLGEFDSFISGLFWSPSANFVGPLSTVEPPETLAVGDSVFFSATFSIPTDIIGDTSLIINPGISSSMGELGFPISIEINTARMKFGGVALSGVDSILDPGESANLLIDWVNSGTGWASTATVSVNCPGGELDIVGSPVTTSYHYLPGDTAHINVFDVSWASGVSPKPIVPLVTQWTPNPPETLYLATMPLGFTTDVEASEFPFVLNPTTYWHRSTRRAHSGSLAWYCGHLSIGAYVSNLDDLLRTTKFVIGDKAELRFWAHAQFPNYGSDGLHIEIAGSADTVELDYIGSGGALLSFIIGWSEYRYSLENLPFAPGDSIEVYFRFTSDADDENEGIFLDDITLYCPGTDFTTSIEACLDLPKDITLQVFPNPFNSALHIELKGDISSESHIEIYDISGRLVAKKLAETSIIWDGISDDGFSCASGIYLVRYINPSMVSTSRAVLLK
ncbi:T9SS type A sorting domain-containing protein [bacterium]|nr:T9SS type A sorting domain-containing protein [bacterium]